MHTNTEKRECVRKRKKRERRRERGGEGEIEDFVCFLNMFLVSLCRNVSNRLKGLPFRPVRAIPVDMFPHTSHCELLLLFERLPESDTPCQPTAPLESEDHTASPSHEPLSSPLADSELQNTPPSLVLSDLQNTSPENQM